MAEIHDLDTTDANNTGRFPENQAPSTVNDGARALEGIIARWEEDTNFSKVATLSGSVIQWTAHRTSLTLTGTTSNYVADLVIGFTMGGNPTTGPTSVNINADSEFHRCRRESLNRQGRRERLFPAGLSCQSRPCKRHVATAWRRLGPEREQH